MKIFQWLLIALKMKSHLASTFCITFCHLDFLFPVQFWNALQNHAVLLFLKWSSCNIQLLSPCIPMFSVSIRTSFSTWKFSVCLLGYCPQWQLQTSVWIHLNFRSLFSLLKPKLSYTAMYPHRSWNTPTALYLCYQAISLFIFSTIVLNALLAVQEGLFLLSSCFISNT